MRDPYSAKHPICLREAPDLFARSTRSVCAKHPIWLCYLCEAPTGRLLAEEGGHLFSVHSLSHRTLLAQKVVDVGHAFFWFRSGEEGLKETRLLALC